MRRTGATGRIRLRRIAIEPSGAIDQQHEQRRGPPQHSDLHVFGRALAGDERVGEPLVEHRGGCGALLARGLVRLAYLRLGGGEIDLGTGDRACGHGRDCPPARRAASRAATKPDCMPDTANRAGRGRWCARELPARQESLRNGLPVKADAGRSSGSVADVGALAALPAAISFEHNEGRQRERPYVRSANINQRRDKPRSSIRSCGSSVCLSMSRQMA